MKYSVSFHHEKNASVIAGSEYVSTMPTPEYRASYIRIYLLIPAVNIETKNVTDKQAAFQ